MRETIALGGSPEGGVWTGTGVIGDMEGYMFYPGAGTQTITYTVFDNNGCSNSASTTIVVNPAPVVTCPANITVCSNTLPFALTGGSPAGGTYTGTGVTAGIFNPASGNGPHLITYTYTDGNSCSAFCTFFITVKAAPVLSNCIPTVEVCENSGPYNLLDIGITPTGGTFTGMFVSGNTFDVNAAGPGKHTVTYTYTDPLTGCSATCIFKMKVNVPDIVCPEDLTIDIDDLPLDLTTLVYSPAGGTFSGNEVSDDEFDVELNGTYTSLLYSDGWEIVPALANSRLK
jgi:hypothetical protein